MATGELKKRIDHIEQAYEYSLAYAAQGLSGDGASAKSGQLREHLNKADEALTGLADLFRARVEEKDLQPRERYEAFLEVLERDAQSSRTAIRLVLAQDAISSQLVDNLNASIHVRALLTDLFLIDEALSSAEKASGAAS